VFSGLINRAKAAASHLVLTYVARVSVAIPFIIAVGFALAASAVMLVQRFGHVAGYWIMAAGLTVIGIVASMVVNQKEHHDEVAEQKTENAGAQMSDGTAQAVQQLPLALLGAQFTTPSGATGAFKAARLLGRNLPLVLLLAMIGAVLWPSNDG
jgi:uncharacterized membrane protein